MHLIRYSLHFASWKERNPITTALKTVYRAEHAEVAKAALEEFGQGVWGRKYPAIAQSWRRNWEAVIPFFAFSPEVSRIIYTTNAIESLHSQVRKSLCNKGRFPSDEAAAKLMWLALPRDESSPAHRHTKFLTAPPIFHQHEPRIKAHVLVAFLAYCLHVTLAHPLQHLAPGLIPRRVLERFAAVQMIDVHIPTTDGRELELTRCTQPDADLKLLLDRLKLALSPQPPPKITTAWVTEATPV